jgi:hypothetical protein
VENPWTKLPRKAPFVLASDRLPIKEFNKRARAEYRIIEHLMPVPYLGSPDAPIVLLHLNAGYSPEDETRQSTKRFRQISRRNLLHQPLSYPFYYLDLQLEGSEQDPGPAYLYWRRRLGKELLDQYGDRLVANKVFCIELFPYRSRYHRALPITLDSQHYGFKLVRQALARQAVVIILRARARWFAAVQELQSYPYKYVLNNPRNATISARNCPEGYPKIVRILEKCRNRFVDEGPEFMSVVE